MYLHDELVKQTYKKIPSDNSKTNEMKLGVCIRIRDPGLWIGPLRIQVYGLVY